MQLWTIGHGTRPIAAFVQVLRAYDIAVLVDIRHFPGSRRNPQFSQAALQPALEAAGIRYVHLVDLGGFRKEGYEAYMANPAWQGGFSALAALAQGARVAIMCAETVPWKCHRRYVAQHAASLGWEVRHILDERRTLPTRPARQATLEPAGPGPGD